MGSVNPKEKYNNFFTKCKSESELEKCVKEELNFLKKNASEVFLSSASSIPEKERDMAVMLRQESFKEVVDKLLAVLNKPKEYKYSNDALRGFGKIFDDIFSNCGNIESEKARLEGRINELASFV